MTGGLPARTPWSGGVLLLTFLLVPAVAYGGPLGFAIMPALAALLLWPLWRRRLAPHPVLLIALALWIWTAASYAWSPAPLDVRDVDNFTGLKLLFVLAMGGLFAGAAANLSGPAARRALLPLAYIAALYAFVLTVESFIADPPLYGFFTRTLAEPVRPDIARVHLGQGTVAMALLAWPLLLVLRRAPGGVFAAAVLLIGAVIAPAMLGQSSTVLALAAGGAVFGLGARFGPAALRLVGGALAILLLAMPWLILAADRSGGLAALAPLTPASTEARLEIWALVSAQVVENPLRGWGLDASRLLPPPVSLHPHNGPLQIWYELGAHGAILAALIWWALLDLAARAAKHDRLGGAAAAAAATAYFVIGALSFGVWQEWWLGLGAVTAAVSAAVLVWRRWDRMAHPSGTEQLRPLELQPL